jgi:hypothetical protein
LAVVAQRAVWLKPQSGTSVRRFGGTPIARTAAIRAATSSSVLEVVILHVDDAGGHVATGVGQDLLCGAPQVPSIVESIGIAHMRCNRSSVRAPWPAGGTYWTSTAR